MHPCLTCSKGERQHSSLIVNDGCSHFVREMSQDGDEIGSTPKPGQDLPGGLTIDGFECFGQVDESQ